MEQVAPAKNSVVDDPEFIKNRQKYVSDYYKSINAPLRLGSQLYKVYFPDRVMGAKKKRRHRYYPAPKRISDAITIRLRAFTRKELIDLAAALINDDMERWVFFRICALAYIHNDPNFLHFLHEYTKKLNVYGGVELHWHGDMERKAKALAQKTLQSYGMLVDANDNAKAVRMFDIIEGVEVPLHTDPTDPHEQSSTGDDE